MLRASEKDLPVTWTKKEHQSHWKMHKFKFELNVQKFVITISVQFCPMCYKGKAGQSSDSSALLPRKIGVLPDLLDVYSALYLPVCSAALCSLSAAL